MSGRQRNPFLVQVLQSKVRKERSGTSSQEEAFLKCSQAEGDFGPALANRHLAGGWGGS